MGAGVSLVILGAILAFAVRADASAVDLQTVGLIFMVAGAAIVAYSRRDKRTERVVTHVEQNAEPYVGPAVSEQPLAAGLAEPVAAGTAEPVAAGTADPVADGTTTPGTVRRTVTHEVISEDERTSLDEHTVHGYDHRHTDIPRRI